MRLNVDTKNTDIFYLTVKKAKRKKEKERNRKRGGEDRKCDRD